MEILGEVLLAEDLHVAYCFVVALDVMFQEFHAYQRECSSTIRLYFLLLLSASIPAALLSSPIVLS